MLCIFVPLMEEFLYQDSISMGFKDGYAEVEASAIV